MGVPEGSGKTSETDNSVSWKEQLSSFEAMGGKVQPMEYFKIRLGLWTVTHYGHRAGCWARARQGCGSK